MRRVACRANRFAIVRRARIRGGEASEGVIVMHRTAIKYDQVVYIAVVNKRVRYEGGRSRIVYIGTTKRGIRRIASSAAAKAQDIFKQHGLKSVHFFVYSVPGRQRVNMARKLERALLLAFKDIYGEPPKFNTQGRRMRWRNEDRYFRRAGLLATIERHQN